MDSTTLAKPGPASDADNATLAEDNADQGPDAEDLRRRYLVRRFWKSARGFWGRCGPRSA
jgi:putative ATP-binding cassette transporter